MTVIQTVARVCGSVRIALNVCMTAFANRERELLSHCSVLNQPPTSGDTAGSAQEEQQQTGGVASPVAAGRSTATIPAGAGGAGANPSSPAYSGIGVTSSVLLTVAGAKNALNQFLQPAPEVLQAVEGGGEGNGAPIS